MTVLQPLFQENDTSDQAARIFRLLFRDLFEQRSGILKDTAFQVTQRAAGANDSVDIKAGSLLIGNTEGSTQGFYHLINDRDVNRSRPAPPHTSLSRIDTIIARVRDSEFPSGQIGEDLFDDALIDWVTGTPVSSSPVPPDLDALGYENYYKLANVSVPAGSPTTPTTSANITDLRTTVSSGTHNFAVGVGGVSVCTSVNRPASPRHGQLIWEEDTKQLVLNEGTTTPSWVTYGTSGLVKWKNFSSGFPVSGSGVISWGRYIKLGRICFGTVGFQFSNTGTGNLTGSVYCRIPVRAANPGISGLVYVGGGRAQNATGFFQSVVWSATGSVLQNDTYMRYFASGSGLPTWDATHPFDWGSGTSGAYQRNDSMEMFFLFESAE
jgi:hypothetical protein